MKNLFIVLAAGFTALSLGACTFGVDGEATGSVSPSPMVTPSEDVQEESGPAPQDNGAQQPGSNQQQPQESNEKPPANSDDGQEPEGGGSGVDSDLIGKVTNEPTKVPNVSVEEGEGNSGGVIGTATTKPGNTINPGSIVNTARKEIGCDRTISVTDNGANLDIIGGANCQRIIVNADGADIHIQEVMVLEVNGNSNKIVVDDLMNAEIYGNTNEITVNGSAVNVKIAGDANGFNATNILNLEDLGQGNSINGSVV